MPKDNLEYVNRFLSLFEKNLKHNNSNSYLQRKLDSDILIYQTDNSEYLDDVELMRLKPLPRLNDYEFLKDKGKTCYIIGGGKTVEFFDFDKLKERLESNDLVIAVNSGSCYFESDVLFYSGQVMGYYHLPDGNVTPLSVNGGFLDQFPHAYSKRPQLVFVPYIFKTDHPANLNTVDMLGNQLHTFLESLEYSDRVTKGREISRETFDKGLKRRRLYGVGPDFGFMAICCAIIWGASKIFLIGFDGRFIELFQASNEMKKEDFLSMMWAGKQDMYFHLFPDYITSDRYGFFVTERNKINRTLFDYLKRYCKKYRIALKFLTPSIYAAKDDYFEL